MQHTTEYLLARVAALENEVKKLNNQLEYQKAKSETLQSALDEAYLFI